MDIPQLLRSVLDVIDSTDPDSEAFLDSGADSIDMLLELEADIRDAIEELTGEYPISKKEFEI
tara:strand:- start:35494 stop:35682 length:189 start_codon:yes stop_codon:yes gene_type:complete